MLLGIRAVIAESYERIHRSNLVGMGVLPLQFLPGESASSLGPHGSRDVRDPRARPRDSHAAEAADGRRAGGSGRRWQGAAVRRRSPGSTARSTSATTSTAGSCRRSSAGSRERTGPRRLPERRRPRRVSLSSAVGGPTAPEEPHHGHHDGHRPAPDRSRRTPSDARRRRCDARQLRDDLIGGRRPGRRRRRRAVRLVLTALLADGHVLVEDVPGTGKTLLARAIARALDLRTNRIQGTPDLLPVDVTGSSLYEGGSLRFAPGPGLHEHPPRRRDQPGHAADPGRAARGDAGAAGLDRGHDPAAARAVRRPRDAEPDRVRGHLRPAPGPARPVPRPDPARLSRRGRASARSPGATRPPPSRSTGSSRSPTRPRLLALRDEVRGVRVADEVEAYLVALVRATRSHPDLQLGASPRATVALYRAAQATALLAGRAFVLPDDVKAIAPAGPRPPARRRPRPEPARRVGRGRAELRSSTERPRAAGDGPADRAIAADDRHRAPRDPPPPRGRRHRRPVAVDPRDRHPPARGRPRRSGPRTGCAACATRRTLSRHRMTWGEEIPTTDRGLEPQGPAARLAHGRRRGERRGHRPRARRSRSATTADRVLRNAWTLAPFERVTRHFHLGATRRGSYELGPVDLVVGDLFAREAAAERRPDVDRFLVRPRTVATDVLQRRDRWGGVDRALAGLSEDPSRFAGVREYAPGDPVRRVHAAGERPPRPAGREGVRAVARPGGPDRARRPDPRRARSGTRHARRRGRRVAVRRRRVARPVAGGRAGVVRARRGRLPRGGEPVRDRRRRPRRPASSSGSSTCSPACRHTRRPSSTGCSRPSSGRSGRERRSSSSPRAIRRPYLPHLRRLERAGCPVVCRRLRPERGRPTRHARGRRTGRAGRPARRAVADGRAPVDRRGHARDERMTASDRSAQLARADRGAGARRSRDRRRGGLDRRRRAG